MNEFVSLVATIAIPVIGASVLSVVAAWGAYLASLLVWGLLKETADTFRKSADWIEFCIWYWKRKGKLKQVKYCEDRLADRDRVSDLRNALWMVLANLDGKPHLLYNLEESVKKAREVYNSTGRPKFTLRGQPYEPDPEEPVMSEQTSTIRKESEHE